MYRLCTAKAMHGLYMGKAPALVLYASGWTSGFALENGHKCFYVPAVFGFFLSIPLQFPITGKVLTII